jgi:hypothetical protein
MQARLELAQHLPRGRSSRALTYMQARQLIIDGSPSGCTIPGMKSDPPPHHCITPGTLAGARTGPEVIRIGRLRSRPGRPVAGLKSSLLAALVRFT